ncbi:MAG: oxygen-independent coproporphyrinogen III oxidase [Xanthobacteraceae bacterium]|nr:MAG: oxygen-independent coproporphyrinogen III oxidase [Xanthobacteraceae bacterium]
MSTPPTVPLALAERSVPRYTSYPTAPYFTPAVNAATYAEWLKALPASATVSLYLHVPYCTSMCLYCGCHTKAVKRREPVEIYTDHLLEEIALIGDLVPNRRVTHIHWGGGTPSILGDKRLREVTAALAARFDFSHIIEHAIELDPRRISASFTHALAAIGFNRASLGAQDFSPHVQQAIGRIQPFDQVAQSAKWLRDAGITRINIDLMYGLPQQTLADVKNSARLAASLQPSRLALFGYAHVPWFKTHQKVIDEATLPGVSERLAQAEAAAETLQAAGYVAIGLDHFALPDDELAIAQRDGRLHRNFQGYTTDTADALIGLGASSIGHLPQGYIQNAVDMGSYARAVSARKLPTVKGLALGKDDRLRAQIIERLMCDLAVDLDEFSCATKTGQRFGDEISRLQELRAAGLLTIDGHRIAMTARGRPFVRLAAAAFDSYLPQNKSRHSLAV